ncbi:MAG: hypothetical protein RSE44_29055, partial [Pseudomonas sp.]
PANNPRSPCASVTSQRTSGNACALHQNEGNNDYPATQHSQRARSRLATEGMPLMIFCIDARKLG